MTLDEFLEYYNNVGASIDDDKYFEHMIVVGYKLNQNSGQRAQENRPGWSTSYVGGEQRGRGAGVSNYAPFGTTSGPTDYTTSQRPQTAQPNANKYGNDNQRRPSEQSSNEDPLLLKFRDKISSRGTRGVLGLSKLFKIADDDESKSLSYQEFAKVLKDLRLEFSNEDVKRLFSKFDFDRNGTIDYDEFIRAVRGPLNQAREKWVKEAFKKLDANGDGIITLDDVRGI